MGAKWGLEGSWEAVWVMEAPALQAWEGWGLGASWELEGSGQQHSDAVNNHHNDTFRLDRLSDAFSWLLILVSCWGQQHPSELL